MTQRTGEQARQVADHIRRAIIGGQFHPGEVLRQERLAKQFAVSRMPVRDALLILDREGFVDLQPNRGAAVAALDPAAYREIYEMRVVAEVLALMHAIPELSNRQLDEAARFQAKMESADIGEFGLLNTAFHAALYAPCGRPLLLAHIASLNSMADRYLQFAIAQLDYSATSHDEHYQLLAACEARDVAVACDVLAGHIEKAGAQLYRLMAAPVC